MSTYLDEDGIRRDFEKAVINLLEDIATTLDVDITEPEPEVVWEEVPTTDGPEIEVEIYP